MRLVHRFIDWFVKSLSNPTKAPKAGLDQANTTATIETPNTAVRERESQEGPVRFHARLSPDTPLAVLLRNGEIAPSWDHDRGLWAHGSWAPASTLYYSSGATSYYNHSLEQWFEIDQSDLLEYLKELRGVVEAPFDPANFDLDEAIQRAQRIRCLQKTRSTRHSVSRTDYDETTSIDYFEHFFQNKFDRAFTFALKTLNAPSYRGLTIEHLLSLHEKGYKSIADILDAPDAVLLSISGIGPKRVASIRANLSDNVESRDKDTESGSGRPVGPVSVPVRARVKLPPFVPLRFYAMLSPETPLAILLRNGEIAPSGAHDQGLEGRGHWEPVSNPFSYNTSYYSQSFSTWIQIDQPDLLKYLKELRRLVEAPLPPGSADLDEAVQRVHQLSALQATLIKDDAQPPRNSEDAPTADYFDYFFENNLDRALRVVLNNIKTPSYAGLTDEHLLSLHANGYKSIASIKDAPDDILLSLPGIGPKRAKMIRANILASENLEPIESVPTQAILASSAWGPLGAADGTPPLTYYLSENLMNAKQKAFFGYVEGELRYSEKVPVGGNVGYLYAYLNKVIADETPETIIEELQKIQALYPENGKLSSQCAEWVSDTHAISGKLEEALRTFPALQISSRSGSPTNKKLCLKLVLGYDVEPSEVLTLFGPKVTKFVCEEFDLIKKYVGGALAEQEGVVRKRLLDEWTEHSRKAPYGYPVYLGTGFANSHGELPYYWFSHSQFVEEFCQEVTRDAENAIRGDRGFPNVGEGWISETRLYYEVKDALPDRKVVHHASPGWLGRQHLDIFLPEDLVAIEFQGEQHDKPIEFFGGVKAFEENIRRDRRKKRLCEENGVCLIYVREGYVLEEVVEAIRTRSGVGGGVP